MYLQTLVLALAAKGVDSPVGLGGLTFTGVSIKETGRQMLGRLNN